MTTETAMQEYLDSLSQVPGSILYRDDYVWKGLLPGLEGQLLTLDANLRPAWTDNPNFWPALIQYDGATSYYELPSFAPTNTAWTFICRFRHPSGGPLDALMTLKIGSVEAIRLYVDDAGVVHVLCKDALNAAYLRVISKSTYLDDQPHYIFLDYHPSTGASRLIVDGQDDAKTSAGNYKSDPATLATSGLAFLQVGQHTNVSNWWHHQIGALGLAQTANHQWQDFMHFDGRPKPIDHTTWSQWGSQPLIWHESGKLDENRGSAGPLTAHGGITLADPLYWS